MSTLEEAVKELKDAFFAQDDARVGELTKKALDAGADSVELLEKYLISWTKQLTEKGWYSGGGFEIAKVGIDRLEETLMLSDLILIAECLEAAVAILRPKLKAAKVGIPGRIVIGTVEGDVHDIGKTIVTSMWTSAGYQVVDLGIDVPASTVVSEAQKTEADIVGLSSSMTMCRVEFGKVVEELKKRGIRDKVKVMIGGQHVHLGDVELFAVDAIGKDVTEAITKSEELMRILKEERGR